MLVPHASSITCCVTNLADDKASVDLELYVNKTTAPGLNSGKDRLEDILVLHLQGGKDFFVSFRVV